MLDKIRDILDKVLIGVLILFCVAVLVLVVLMMTGLTGEPIGPEPPNWETLMRERSVDIAVVHLEEAAAEIQDCQCPEEWVRILHSTSRRK